MQRVIAVRMANAHAKAIAAKMARAIARKANVEKNAPAKLSKSFSGDF